MKRIACLSLKGGVGKTLSSIALASVLSEAGKVAVLDLDPQGSARSWAAGGALPFPVLAAWEAHTLPQGLDYLVYDSPPNDSKTLIGLAETANYLVIPLRVGAQEIDRLQPTLELLAGAKLLPEAKLGVLVTDAGRDGLTAAMPEVLESQGLPLLGVIPHRVGYQRAFSQRIPEELLEPYRGALKEIGL